MKKSKKVELLSPAGNLKKLKIAFAYGADAVYGGVSHYSLRIRSGKEFDMDSFAEGIEYAHSLGKKVYATINGFPFNSQIKLFAKHIEAMARLSPDAFIVSTPGVIKLCKEIAPHIPLHLSTQANVMNYLDAEVYYELGVSRIIAAREISLKDLVEIKKRVPELELEIFVHGSMCFAYSGRCLISSVQSGRVPNRGSCANDCRFEYTLYAQNPETGTLFKLEEVEGEGTYIMNAKDLNLASHIKEILDSGVIDSLKIEGRTKSDYYAAITTKAYRMAIDDYYKGVFEPEKYQAELHTTKHRGFTDGYLVSRPYEKGGTQKLDSSISEGTHQVKAEVMEDGLHFLTKDKICKGDILEIVAPEGAKLEPCSNEIGSVFEKDGRWWLKLEKIEANKEYECIHSGNVNPVKLPCPLPAYTFLRKKIDS
ncbi:MULTISPECIES: peptidase U32 family protein [unclassified Nitratiruptor]|uniref:peptidase U32 family protein n=1 Tax=unclassified Nitratiruptor TaxID=2624044 RepID=UPI00191582C3|nr:MULTISPECIES: U32 family peptidase [unclassified Nitratiruptor]BCD60819.1 putative protease [Nitratiruptor sp. YY08-10]BCD64751.1 putative protease [Nitratiruptor sp. YY08-14]